MSGGCIICGKLIEGKNSEYTCEKCLEDSKDKNNYAIVFYRCYCKYKDYYQTLKEALEWVKFKDNHDDCYVTELVDMINHKVLAKREGPFDNSFENSIKELTRNENTDKK